MNEESTHQIFTIIVESGKQEEFERELEHIKGAYGASSVNEAIIKLIFDFRRLSWKAEHYDKIRDFALKFEESVSIL
ncbi:MAG: hypothetical protein AYK18_14925 [Theionarchaea archaeon DG-70]|nr:MAG: hypothetical protein AYK18_14925 [Theionarchaea archaeon DG-70]